MAKLLGINLLEEKIVKSEGLKVKFIQLGETRIELLYPIDDSSTVKKFLKKNGPGLHHIAIQVDNIEKTIIELKKAGFSIIDEEPRIGAEGYKAIFIHPKSVEGVLLELIEK